MYENMAKDFNEAKLKQLQEYKFYRTAKIKELLLTYTGLELLDKLREYEQFLVDLQNENMAQEW
jgi:hypothetical protein